MSQYSEMMGSFIRTGNYPIEANYIFPTIDDLNLFYEDELNKTTIHSGLLRIVEDEKALYWAVPNEDESFSFEKLIDVNTFNNIEELKDKLELEIQDRIDGDNTIWGTVDPTQIDQELNTILKIANAILDIKEDVNDLFDKSDTLKKELQAVVGTNAEDIIEYISTLDYGNLTKISETLHYFLQEYDESKDTIDTLPELQAFLEGFTDKDTLLLILTDLWHNILGDPLPNTLFRTLRGIQDFVEALSSYSKNRMNNIQTELDLTQVGVGLSGDGAYNADQETYYLKNATSVMNALKILDSLINEAINNCHYESEDSETVKIDIKKEPEKTTIKAWVKVSPEPGNDIIAKEDGIYHNIDSEYKNGILTIKVNGNIRQLHVLGLSSIVEDAHYDPDLEAIIIIFRLLSGEKQTITIPTGALIQEWDVDNSISTKVVELNKERVLGGGIDKLSADVRVSTNKYNILEKDANTLLVKGTADNIVYDGDVTVKSKLDSLTNEDTKINDSLTLLNTNLTNEIHRATEAEKDINLKLEHEITRSKERDNLLTELLQSETLRAKDAEKTLQDDLLKETQRATTTENNISIKLQSEIDRSKSRDDLLDHRIDDLKEQLDSNLAGDTDLSKKVDTLSNNLTEEINRAKLEEQSLSHKIDSETLRAENAESNLNTKIESVLTVITETINVRIDTLLDNLNLEILRSTLKDSEIDDKINDINVKLNNEITRATSAENVITSELSNLKDSLTDNSNNISDLSLKLLQEITRATNLDLVLDSAILLETERATNAETRLKSDINSNTTEIDKSNVKISNLENKVQDQDNTILELTNTVNLNKELLNDAILREKDRALAAEQSLSGGLDNHIKDFNNPHRVTAEQVGAYTKSETDLLVNGNVSDVKDTINNLKDDFTSHINNTDNPHHVTKEQIGLNKVDNTTDLEKPVSVAVQKELNDIQIELSKKAEGDTFLDHVLNNLNPHNVNKEQVGLGNVDNTADIDKPISSLTLDALDKKSDIGHKHVMSDIEDLENLPIVKGTIELLVELPDNPEHGEKWLLKTLPKPGDIVRYEIVEYDAVNLRWNLKLLTTGGITCVIDGDVYKLNSTGLERILDVSDYLYFYNKIYDETKDLIEDIDWEENDATNDTNQQIRLKITYKTKYGDPNEDEATNPYKAKAVKYIDIDKSRFLANAYSRPATQDDINNGYATSIGEPLLILVMTTGDHVTISLKDSLNIYDPVDTPSIDMSVSDWTGNPSTSYKVSADVKIATNLDKNDAISLHILNGTEKGMYSTLHTTNTNSITLTPNHGTAGLLKTLTADLNINNSLNDKSDVLLTIDTSGLSAKIIWGEYD